MGIKEFTVDPAAAGARDRISEQELVEIEEHFKPGNHTAYFGPSQEPRLVMEIRALQKALVACEAMAAAFPDEMQLTAAQAVALDKCRAVIRSLRRGGKTATIGTVREMEFVPEEVKP